jgi:DNA-binding LacI/PurR family transcriptional regulator
MIAAASHLTAFGHRRILFLVRYPQLSVTSERIATIENLAEESRGALQPRIMAFGDDLDLFERSFPEALRGPDAPTAIIVSNSILALWVARALRRLGLSWPRDLSIVAFDEPIWGDLVTPGLTIVRQPIAQLAEVALDLLHERIAGVHMGGARHIVLEAELVSRGSTAPCPPDGVRPAP